MLPVGAAGRKTVGSLSPPLVRPDEPFDLSHGTLSLMSATIPLPDASASEDLPELGTSEAADLVSAVREGIPTRRFDALNGLIGVSTQTLADVVGISPSTLSRRRGRGRFKKDESERRRTGRAQRPSPRPLTRRNSASRAFDFPAIRLAAPDSAPQRARRWEWPRRRRTTQALRSLYPTGNPHRNTAEAAAGQSL